MDHCILFAYKLEVEECYTATWRESKYTLIRLSKENRIRRTAFARIIHLMKDDHGIIGTEIFGFDVVSCNSQTDDEKLSTHPGFNFIVQMLNTDITKLEWWMKEGEILSNRKGLLWKYLKDTDPKQMTRAQLIQRVKEWGPSIKEFTELKTAYSFLMAKQDETEHAYKSASSRYENEKKLNEEFTRMLTAKMNECCELKKELIRLRPLTMADFTRQGNKS